MISIKVEPPKVSARIFMLKKSTANCAVLTSHVARKQYLVLSTWRRRLQTNNKRTTNTARQRELLTELTKTRYFVAYSQQIIE